MTSVSQHSLSNQRPPFPFPLLRLDFNSGEIKFTMKNSDLERGSRDVDMIKHLLDHHVNNEASHRNQSPPSIFKVPCQLREVSPDSFSPKVVSIGPLHREDENVRAFEEHKSSYLIKLMSRINDFPKEDVWETCMEKANISMNRIKACYVWPKRYSDAKIAEMMVIDACFILEFTYQLVHGMEEACYVNKMQLSGVVDDLVLLENQIPLFFLKKIYKRTILKFTSNVSLNKLINKLLNGQINSIFSTTLESHIDNDSITTAPHILSLLHQCFMPPDNIKEVMEGSRIPSAIDLDMAGVNFKPSQNPTWKMGIEMKQYKFPYSPTLAMPVLKVQDSTELILRNLIAYEQSFKTKSYVTSYFDAMDRLVNTQEDVAKLVDSEVIINCMGSNEEVAKIINNLGKNVTVCTFYEEEWKKVKKYSDGYWPKHIAKMRSTYFRSPWTIIALFAGIVLFVLQVVQTIFTITSSGNNK